MSDAELELHPEAIEDALEGYAWYLQRSERTADHFLADLDHAVSLILERPHAWPAHVLGTRRFVLTRFPYSIVYRATEARTIVYAFAHAKRRPRYWRDRLAWDPANA